MTISLFALAACNRAYEPGDYYGKEAEGIVLAVDTEGNATMLLSLDEAKDLDADSAAKWAASLGEGWYLPTKEEMALLKKYKSLVNITLERKKLPALLAVHTFYWSSTPCSDSHQYALGPDGVRCYFKTNASPYYRARAVKKLKTEN